MERIKEKPTLGERVKEKAVSAPKELLRKGLDDGSERLRTQLRDTAQQGRRDEYGGDAIEDTAASGLRRAEKELLKQRKKKNAEQSASPQGDASAPSSNSDVPPVIRTREAEAARVSTPPPPAQEQARQAAMKQAVKTKNAYISARGETTVTAAPEPQRQGQQAFIQEQGRKASRQQVQRRQAERRFQRQDDLRGDSLCSEGFEPTSRGRIKERGGIQPPKKRQFPEPKTPNHAAGIVPKAREGSKSAVLSSEQAMHSTTVHATAAGTHAAREAAMQMALRQQTTKMAETAVQKTAQAAGCALRSIIAAAQSLLAAIAAGGSTVVAMVLVICLIGLLIVSPFGIFFSGEDSGTGYTMPEAVSVLNGEFAARIEQIKAENPYDELDMDNAGSAAMISNWRDVLAVYAVRTTTDNASPDEVATLTEEKLDILRQIFWDMNAISYWVETISGDKDESDTVILHITVTVKDHLQMADEYRFNAEQHKLLEELMQPEYQELFAALTGSYQDIELSPDEVAKIMENLPADLSEARREVVLTAYQLLGKVHYFWGGKSLVIGWDSRWGMPMEVTAGGSSTTGTVRPFGLDCSGMVDWVFYNQSGGQYVIGHGGGATAQHSYCTPIAWSDAQPGDLVFYPGDSHVGIVCGFDSGGNIMIIHCASGANNVVVTGKIGFTSIGRPEYFAD
ncbi:peptidoglycan endopeptidase [Ruminococcaceae bacterium AF10-16]|nr:peptidoglycan endopeptidase [Ruminococcaceae bacterium AF10-16]